MYKKIGIICAADVELAPFLPRIENRSITETAMMKFHSGYINSAPVVAVECGVCRVNAAAAAQILIDNFAVDAVINAGTAGGMDASVGLFDTVISTRAAYHDIDEHILTAYHPRLPSAVFDSDRALLLAAENTARKNPEFCVRFGVTVTGEKFIGDDFRDEINAKFSPLAVDMETAGIAHVCHINKIPFIAIRTVTDTAEHSGMANFKANCERASGISAAFVSELLRELKNNGQLGTVLKKHELADEIYRASHLTGRFRLRSGQTSDEYFDKYLFESEPLIMASIAENMAKLIPEGTEVLAGLEMGGIPLAAALSLKTGIPAAFVRKKAKEYGTCKLAEGVGISGKKICIIEDVVTTGGQIILSADELRKRGAAVGPVLCVILRDEEGRDKLRAAGLELFELFAMNDLIPRGDTQK